MDTEPVVTLTFEEPPPKTKYDWEAISRLLQAKPREWFKVFERDRLTVAKAIQNGDVKALTPFLRKSETVGPGYQVQTRHTNTTATPPTCTLYVRYVPGKKG
jgi:nitrate reductase assembly molybdenum cofactor insertion protein NarJ